MSQDKTPQIKQVSSNVIKNAEKHFGFFDDNPLKFKSFSEFIASLKYSQLSFVYEPDDMVLWATITPTRPCYTLSLLQELNDFHSKLRNHFKGQDYSCHECLHFLVWKSGIPGIFNLGGDLPYFVELIRANEKERLLKYAHSCVEAVFNNYDNFGLPIINIALVQGDSLGGGFESVLSSAVVISEKSSQFGLPEVMFNMFPGMGAYSLLSRRLGNVKAEKMILSGRICSAAELYDMGIIDIVAEDGDGEMAVNDYIKRHKRSYLSISAVHDVRKLVSPMALKELKDITELWVENAFKVSDMDLKKMERLYQAQERRFLRSIEQ